MEGAAGRARPQQLNYTLVLSLSAVSVLHALSATTLEILDPPPRGLHNFQQEKLRKSKSKDGQKRGQTVGMFSSATRKLFCDV